MNLQDRARLPSTDLSLLSPSHHPHIHPSSSSCCFRSKTCFQFCAFSRRKTWLSKTRLPSLPFNRFSSPKQLLITMGILQSIPQQGREWSEYEEAVQTSDLARALQILQTLNTLQSDAVERMEEGGSTVAVPEAPQSTLQNTSLNSAVGLLLQQREQFFRVLDACQTASDMNLVAKAYEALKMLDLIPNFGRYKSYAFEGARVVTPAVMMSSAGLEASKLSPKKWGLSGSSAIVLALTFGTLSSLIYSGIEVRPLLAATLGLGFLDAIFLGGTGLGQILYLWLPYRKRVMVHEAGHILVAYLLGCPVRGVVLDATQAIRVGIQGQAGTQFWDETLEEELRQGQLTNASLDRYSMVLFAGIAAEALVYGEAEGGENDENLYKAIISQLRPPWSSAKMSNQARWAVLESYKLLKEHRRVHNVTFHALEAGENMSSVVRAIENVMASREYIERERERERD